MATIDLKNALVLPLLEQAKLMHKVGIVQRAMTEVRLELSRLNIMRFPCGSSMDGSIDESDKNLPRIREVVSQVVARLVSNV